jgi:hypothetical protein
MTNTFSVGELYDENNIRHARDLGYIVGETQLHSEYEAHEGFFYANTRKLHPVALAILHYTRVNARACILGHGAGGETSQIFRLRPDIHIDSLGLSPIDPFYPFVINATDPLTPNDNVALEHKINNSTIDELRSNRQKLQSIFTQEQMPYIATQHCVQTIGEADIEPNSIDFLYENCGYLYYDPQNSSTAETAVNLLSNQGIAMLPLTAGVYAYLRSENIDHTMLNITLLDRKCILTGSEHSLYTLLSKNYNSIPNTHSNKTITYQPITLCRELRAHIPK